MSAGEKMAEHSHLIWARKALNDINTKGGFMPIPLVPWDLLTDFERRKDRFRAMEILKFLQYHGYKVNWSEFNCFFTFSIDWFTCHLFTCHLPFLVAVLSSKIQISVLPNLRNLNEWRVKASDRQWKRDSPTICSRSSSSISNRLYIVLYYYKNHYVLIKKLTNTSFI